MSANFEPNPPSRKPGGFPKTTTMPEGWVMDELMEYYNGGESASQDGVNDQAGLEARSVPVPTTGRPNGKVHHEEAETAAEESPFARKLEPFPSKVDLRGTLL